jgi:hypothetical protein
MATSYPSSAVRLYHKGFNEIRTNDAITALLYDIASNIARRANSEAGGRWDDSFKAKAVNKAGRKNRAHAWVTANAYGSIAEAKSGALARAFAEEL